MQQSPQVQQGDVLIELDTADAEAEVNTINAEIERLHIERARISVLLFGLAEAPIEGDPLRDRLLERFAQDTDIEHTFYMEQAQLLGAEVDDLQAAFDGIAAQIIANDQSIAVTQANIERVNAAIDIQTERLEVAQDLLERGTSSRASFLDVQDAFTALEQERNIHFREIEQKRSQEVALLADRRSTITSQRNRLLQRRSEIEARLATLNEQLQTAERRVLAAQLTAPMTGVVDQLEVFTIGAVGKAGEQLLRVVPEDQDIEIEAVFYNSDIGFVEIGQQANINFEAYPSARFGFVSGVVSGVAADSTEASDGIWAFAVRISPNEGQLTNGSELYALRPGMTATIDITTDQRRLISYFFAPIVNTVQNALGER